MKEIGGYFELEQLVKNEYYPELIALNSARYALVYLLRARGIKKIALPYLLCHSVERACREEGCEVVFYEIGEDFRPCTEGLSDDVCLYLVNYYGQLSDAEIAVYQSRSGGVILDHVQAFFQKPISGVDTIYSCRKFFGVPDGAYLATDVHLDEVLPEDISMERTEHLLGRFEKGSASDYYSAFKANDAAFTAAGLRKMSRLTHNLLGAIDYEAACAKRLQNYALLSKAFEKINPLRLSMPVGPFAYPLYLENGAEMKQKLAYRHIYVPTLWPDDQVRKSPKAWLTAQNILPLPCDQRYGEAEMLTVIDEVKRCIV